MAKFGKTSFTECGTVIANDVTFEEVLRVGVGQFFGASCSQHNFTAEATSGDKTPSFDSCNFLFKTSYKGDPTSTGSQRSVGNIELLSKVQNSAGTQVKAGVITLESKINNQNGKQALSGNITQQASVVNQGQQTNVGNVVVNIKGKNRGKQRTCLNYSVNLLNQNKGKTQQEVANIALSAYSTNKGKAIDISNVNILAQVENKGKQEKSANITLSAVGNNNGEQTNCGNVAIYANGNSSGGTQTNSGNMGLAANTIGATSTNSGNMILATTQSGNTDWLGSCNIKLMSCRSLLAQAIKFLHISTYTQYKHFDSDHTEDEPQPNSLKDGNIVVQAIRALRCAAGKYIKIATRTEGRTPEDGEIFINAYTDVGTESERDTNILAHRDLQMVVDRNTLLSCDQYVSIVAGASSDGWPSGPVGTRNLFLDSQNSGSIQITTGRVVPSTVNPNSILITTINRTPQVIAGDIVVTAQHDATFGSAGDTNVLATDDVLVQGNGDININGGANTTILAGNAAAVIGTLELKLDSRFNGMLYATTGHTTPVGDYLDHIVIANTNHTDLAGTDTLGNSVIALIADKVAGKLLMDSKFISATATDLIKILTTNSGADKMQIGEDSGTFQSLLTNAFREAFNAHIHTGVTPGGGVTGVPQTQLAEDSLYGGLPINTYTVEGN